MGLLVAFVAGCVVGAKAGGQDFTDVKQSVQSIRESQEFRDLVSAVRSHGGQTLRRIADMVDNAVSEGRPADDLVDRVRHLVARD